MSLYRYIFLLILFQLMLLATFAQGPKREFRGIWIATVNNIDWPSKPGLSVEKQKEELLDMLNTLEQLNFNAVIFQIRSAGDAFYKSSTEPWSYWLTGEQGKAPQQQWDPLHFIVEECHKRGMELHAWMNPFRLSQNLSTNYHAKNIARRHPEWVVTYGNKQYLDPGIPDVRAYLNQVVGEVVRKYDIDAIHFDDYFYPYPITGQSFPDEKSFEMYNWGMQTDQIDQWRRDNVDLIIESLSKTIKRMKPHVKFGISPFGVWKNYDEADEIKGSVTTAGNTNYENLYADVIKWQQNGWIDYMIPQLYWEIGHPAVDFITLANWWSERSFGHHVYVGHALYKSIEGKSPAWQNDQEIPEQILITRKMKNLEGSAFFRMDYLERNPHRIKNKLSEEIYREKALLPTMGWLDSTVPVTPRKVKAQGLFKTKRIKIKFNKNSAPGRDHLGYLFYVTPEEQGLDLSSNRQIVGFSREEEIDISQLELPNKGIAYLWLTVIDKHHNESKAIGPVKIKTK